MPCTPTTRDLSIVWEAQAETIRIEENGTRVDDLTVCPGDTLQYTSNLAWAVQFIAEGPANNPNRQNPPVDPYALTGAPDESWSVEVDEDATPGDRWDYVVVVVDDEGYIRTEDPDIVIGSR